MRIGHRPKFRPECSNQGRIPLGIDLAVTRPRLTTRVPDAASIANGRCVEQSPACFRNTGTSPRRHRDSPPVPTITASRWRVSASAPLL